MSEGKWKLWVFFTYYYLFLQNFLILAGHILFSLKSTTNNRDQLEYNEFIAELEDSDEDLLADAMESVSLVATEEDDGKGRST